MLRSEFPDISITASSTRIVNQAAIPLAELGRHRRVTILPEDLVVLQTLIFELVAQLAACIPCPRADAIAVDRDGPPSIAVDMLGWAVSDARCVIVLVERRQRPAACADLTG